MDVNDRHLDFSDIIGTILYGNFNMLLPPTFQRITTADNTPSDDNSKKDATGKKRKAEISGDGNEKKEKSVIMKNTSQHEAFVMKPGETWKKNFKSTHVNHRPSWNGKNTQKMCIKFHIEGSCFSTCDRVESHIPKDQIPAEKVAEMCAFIAKCRGE